MNQPSFFHSPILQVALCIIVYLALVIPTASVNGIANDEFIDLRISQSYFKSLDSIFTGNDIDPTQARLPMFLTAVGNLMAKKPNYVSARYVSCFFAMLTIIGVYLFCYRELNQRIAIFASGILATSPYFLAFSKGGMTEGDIFLSCALTWLMVCLGCWIKKPNLGRTVLVGVAAGIAVSTKIVAAVLVPALLPIMFLARYSKPFNGNKQALLLTVFISAGLIFLVYGFFISGAPHVAVLNKYYDHRLPMWKKYLHYSSVSLPWVCLVIGGIFYRSKKIHPLLAIILIFSASLLTFFAIPPAHTTNGSLLQGIYREFAKNSSGLSGMVIYSAAGLNALSLIIKSGPAIGIFFIVSLLVSFFQLHKNRILLIPIIFILIYPAFLSASGRAQTFYMIAVLPQFALLAAFVLNIIYEKSKKSACLLLALFALNITYDIKVSYPDYHLNGYQYIGERYIAGRSSVGFKGIVQTPSDGTMQVIDWAWENIPPGKRVTTYLRYRLMISRLGPGSRPPFHVRNGLDPKWDLSQADYVLVHLNYMIDIDYHRKTSRPSIYNYLFDIEELHRDFEKVFTVEKAFGIEVASVWKRKKPFLK